MLKPHELFIGAALNLHSNHSDFSPIILNIEDLKLISNDCVTFNLNHSPIPLTPEILVNWCGWEKIYESKYRIQLWCEPKSEFKFEFFKETKTIVLTWNGLHTNIQYLHQLQALYALLTGEVMPINLPKNQ